MMVESDVHPLIEHYEKRLSGLIGVLSRYIVKRQCADLNGHLGRKEAHMIASRIADESSVLIGDTKASLLKEEYFRLTDDFFREVKEDEGKETD